MKTQEDGAVGWRYTDPECRNKLVSKLLYPFKSGGFQQLRMDDVAKQMDISKATLYKYFSSKEEIVAIVVDLFIRQIIDLYKDYLGDSELPYPVRFQKSFPQTLLIANYGSEPFMNDLRDSLPELYERLDAAVGARNESLKEFYEAGMEAKAFHRQNATLIVMQDELMCKQLVNPVVLMKNNLTLQNAICDYYRMRKLQVLTPEAHGSLDDSELQGKLDMLVKKIMFGMA